MKRQRRTFAAATDCTGRRAAHELRSTGSRGTGDLRIELRDGPAGRTSRRTDGDEFAGGCAIEAENLAPGRSMVNIFIVASRSPSQRPRIGSNPMPYRISRRVRVVVDTEVRGC
jgi:hypothetical protein